MLELVNLLAETALSGEVSGLFEKIQKIVETITTVIYIALGMFLVIKGSLLGLQIVKAADEPQVRQEKIGSLKWLVIGVAIAAAVTTVARVVTNYFEAIFK